MLKFYLECFKKTKPAYAIARNVGFCLSLFMPFGTWIYRDISEEPISGALMSALMWQIPLGILALLSIIQFLMAPYWMYEELKKSQVGALKELRELRRNELYTYIPEANYDRIFRIFFDLYKEGEFLKLANTERRQKWDEKAIKTLIDFCGSVIKDNYLRDTGRRLAIYSPLMDENYDKAVSIIKEIVYSSNFGDHIQSR